MKKDFICANSVYGCTITKLKIEKIQMQMKNNAKITRLHIVEEKYPCTDIVYCDTDSLKFTKEGD